MKATADRGEATPHLRHAAANGQTGSPAGCTPQNGESRPGVLSLKYVHEIFVARSPDSIGARNDDDICYELRGHTLETGGRTELHAISVRVEEEQEALSIVPGAAVSDLQA